LVLRTYALQVGYADEGRPLFTSPDLVLERGECVALIGPNGAGKTTFLKTILGQIPTYSGSTLLGASLKVGYFAQAHEDLDATNDLIQEINTVAPNMLPAQVRNYLARYGFQGEQVFDRVATLSGGERGRLALAKLALSDANLLLLDEPTNHLDLPTQEVLQNVLSDYPGTILLVSHDRYLIDALATQIWELLPTEERLRDFKGSYSEYKEFLNNRNKPETSSVDLLAEKTNLNIEKPKQSSLSRNQRQQLQKKIAAVEAKVHSAETEKATWEAQLASPPADPRKLQKITDAYQAVNQRLEELLVEWESLAETLHRDDSQSADL
jgi:ATP-binding cassette subfamily F protein 3